MIAFLIDELLPPTAFITWFSDGLILEVQVECLAVRLVLRPAYHRCAACAYTNFYAVELPHSVNSNHQSLLNENSARRIRSPSYALILTLQNVSRFLFCKAAMNMSISSSLRAHRIRSSTDSLFSPSSSVSSLSYMLATLITVSSTVRCFASSARLPLIYLLCYVIVVKGDVYS